MHQTVTLRGGYVYQFDQLCIINLSEGAVWLNDFVVLIILR